MRRRRLVLTIAVITAVVVGIAVAVWALTRPPSVEDAAERYLIALSEGDFTTIAEMRGSTLDAEAEGVLADAFAGAAYGSSPQIDEISPSGQVANVRASLDLGGDRHAVSFGLALEAGRWLLATDYLASLDVTTSLGDSVWVGDALVPVGSVTLLPAVYPVSAAPRDILDGGWEVPVSNDAPASAAIEAALADGATEQAQAQLDEYLDRCITPAATPPDACGIRIPWGADLAALDGVTYRVEQRPVLALAADAGTFAAAGGILVATASGTAHDGQPGEFTYRADDWTLYGTIAFSGDELVLAVR